MNLEFKLAKTLEEKEDIFRFRYDIYIKEMGRNAHADHNKEMIYDEYDETGHLFYVNSINEMVGTARINFKKENLIEFEKEYMIENFKPYFPDRISTITKMMLNKTHRNGKVISYFFNEMYKYGLKQNVAIDLINCNFPLDSFYEKIGYRRYKPNFTHPNFGSVIPMALFLYDTTHIKTVRSPLCKSVDELNIKEDNDLIKAKSNFTLFNYHMNL
jgi:predicted GNAT family N-acyltransferase